MRDVKTQLVDYLDHVVPRVDVDEIMQERVGAGPVRPIQPRQPKGRVPGWVAGAAAAAVILLIGLSGALIQRGSEVGSEPAPPLGVFEPLRGRIVVLDGQELVGIDPADPASPVIVDIPDLSPLPKTMMPAGWSSDGRILALDSEHADVTYLVDDAGTVSRVPWELVWPEDGGGCCAFVTSPWLSPDGSHAAVAHDLGLVIVDLGDMSIESQAQLDPEEFPGLFGYGQIYAQTWSPDGTEVAVFVTKYENGAWIPSIQIYRRDENTFRELPTPGFGHIRNLSWSPDGTQLLVIAGDMVDRSNDSTLNNPLGGPVATSLYLFPIDGGAPRVIADGHFVVATWSPDASQIAAIDFPAGHDLVVMNADGTNFEKLMEMNGSVYGGLWTGVTWHPLP